MLHKSVTSRTVGQRTQVNQWGKGRKSLRQPLAVIYIYIYIYSTRQSSNSRLLDYNIYPPAVMHLVRVIVVCYVR
jgi:hypothetical protein